MGNELIALLRKAELTAEQKEAVDKLELQVKEAEKKESELEDLRGKVDVLEDDVKLYKTEAGEAKGKHKKATSLIDDLKAQIEEKEGVIAKNSEQLAELDKLKELKVEKDNQLRSSYNEKIEALKELPVFEKIKEKIVLPTEEAPLDKLEIDQIESSLSKINEWEEVGAFQVKDSRGVSNQTDPQEAKPDFIKGFENSWGRK